MITGFNTNVRHGGRVFHVQTEDSGLAHPHVISHLYYGGTILGSEKTQKPAGAKSGVDQAAKHQERHRQVQMGQRIDHLGQTGKHPC